MLTAHGQRIELGTITDNQYTVLNGIHAGDEIITGGIQKLQPGVPIMILPPETDASPQTDSPSPEAPQAD